MLLWCVYFYHAILSLSLKLFVCIYFIQFLHQTSNLLNLLFIMLHCLYSSRGGENKFTELILKSLIPPDLIPLSHTLEVQTRVTFLHHALNGHFRSSHQQVRAVSSQCSHSFFGTDHEFTCNEN